MSQYDEPAKLPDELRSAGRGRRESVKMFFITLFLGIGAFVWLAFYLTFWSPYNVWLLTFGIIFLLACLFLFFRSSYLFGKYDDLITITCFKRAVREYRAKFHSGTSTAAQDIDEDLVIEPYESCSFHMHFPSIETQNPAPESDDLEDL